ncbi:MAG: M14 family zinc carboxypeptidase [Gemmatimonadaceae bacterium]
MRPLITLAILGILPNATLAQQRNDEEYTRKIKEYLRDPRITTELVDHLPASNTVPTPLKFHGRIVGTPGELTYAKDIQRYFEALDQASDRVKTWSIGKSEEGRDMIVLAVADAATIRSLDTHKARLAALTDPRRTSEAAARQLIQSGKPIYWITSGMHSPETGGPEMLQELAYRLAVEETPLVQTIRNNVITFITPVIEVDGREKQVDTYYFNKKLPRGQQRLPLMYWGKYVAHDNNRDNIGQMLKLSQHVNQFFLEWHPPIMHDLHEASNYLYTSTGTGPYNEALDPITVDEWWLLAKTEVMELTKRGIPGVWTYGFYDGWTPNYMFFAAHAHNATGRFYEVQSYGPDTTTVRLGATQTSREWFRPNPPLPSIAWGPRNNTNIQQSALLIALHHVAKNKELYLENYWLKNKRSVEKGRKGPTYGWVLPALQRRKGEVADAVNSLRDQGLEFHTANAPFTVGGSDVKPGDYIVRADQPYRTFAEMYFSVQNFPVGNPRPYDDTGWTYQLLRNIKLVAITDTAFLTQPMTLVTAAVTAPGGIAGAGPVLVVEHNTDNALVTFRFRHRDVAMHAAQEAFDLNGRSFAAGAFIIPNADRARLEPTLKELGLSAWATATVPNVKTHELDVPRIGYVHSWQRTQDEGWVRGALDRFGVPYTYFADQKLRDGNLRSKYDVIIYPHVGGSAQSQVNGIQKNPAQPALPYKKTEATPNLGVQDASEDIRGGMGLEGLTELAKFVQQGGTLLVEGSTTLIFPEYGLTNGITIEEPQGLFARGSVFRGIFADKKSPIAYGYDGTQLPVYFNQAPVINAGGSGVPGELAGFLGGQQGPSQNITPMAQRLRLSPWESDTTVVPRAGAPSAAPASGAGAAAAAGAGGAAADTSQAAQVRQMAQQFGINVDDNRPRVVLHFPANPNDMLLSGTLQNGQLLANRAQVLDAKVGNGHVVMFGIRPFWRWQTQGTFFLAFNTILNWNDLDAGKTPPRPTATSNMDGQR